MSVVMFAGNDDRKRPDLRLLPEGFLCGSRMMIPLEE